MGKLSAKELRRFLDWLLELSTCPVCHETLQPTTALCVNGHPICVSCRQGLHTAECPLCRDQFSDVRPTGFIHQVIEALPHPCRHEGCEYFVKTKDDHEKFCSYKTTVCRYCDWSGTAREIVTHLYTVHRATVEKYLRPDASDSGMPFNPTEECSTFTPIFVNGHFFWGEMKNEPGAKKLTAVIHVVPNGKTTSVFKAHIKLRLRGSYGARIKLNMDPEADPYQDNCVSIPTSILHKFTVGNKFEYRIVLVKSKWESFCNFVRSKIELFKN